MNRNDFLKMMESSVGSDRQLIGEINELIGIFPWFQSAHLLLLKGLHDSGDVRFGNQLRNSALHIADREILYNLLQEPAMEEKQQVQPENSGNITEIPVEDLNKLPETSYSENNDTESVIVMKDVADQEQTVIDSAKNSDDLIRELESDLPGTENEENPDESAEDSQVMNIMPDEISPAEENIAENVKNQHFPDTDSLLELDQEISGDEDEMEIPVREEDTRVLQSELIDRFIIANPRIGPVREKTDEPVEDRALPYNEGEAFVTETLAKIYISQGYYSKAIDIFEKLSLKFPEKSSYFATQIEKVKEYLKK
jgi:hypothetical protein